MNEALQDTLARVTNLRRTLALARQVRDNAFNLGLVADCITALARQLNEAELEAARLIGPTGYTLPTGGFISVVRDDRRGVPRPRILLRPGHQVRVVA